MDQSLEGWRGEFKADRGGNNSDYPAESSGQPTTSKSSKDSRRGKDKKHKKDNKSKKDNKFRDNKGKQPAVPPNSSPGPSARPAQPSTRQIMFAEDPRPRKSGPTLYEKEYNKNTHWRREKEFEREEINNKLYGTSSSNQRHDGSSSSVRSGQYSEYGKPGQPKDRQDERYGQSDDPVSQDTVF